MQYINSKFTETKLLQELQQYTREKKMCELVKMDSQEIFLMPFSPSSIILYGTVVIHYMLK